MASITVTERNELTGLIVTMFNAAPGADVLNQVVAAREAGASLQSIANALATKPQFEQVYPSFLTAQEFADRAVDNLLAPTTPAGAETWAKNWIVGKLNAGESPQAVLLQAAQALSLTSNSNYADSKALLLNKIAVANHHSVVREQPSTNLADLQEVLDGVTKDAASVDAAKDRIDDNLDGLTFTLTTGADDFKGSAGDDEFRALSVGADGKNATTFSAFDKLDGGAGTDTLEIYVDGAENATFPANATVKNVEIININNVGAAFAPVNAANFVGATQINQKALASAVTNLASTTTAGFYELDGPLSVTAANNAATASVNFFNVADTVTLDVLSGAAGTLSTVNITGTVVDVAAGKVDPIATAITVGKDVETLTVNSAVAVDLTVNDGAGKKVSSVDASASTGDLTYSAAGTVANIKSGAGKDTITLATAFTTALTAASLVSGDGDDTLVIAVDNTADVAATVTVDAGKGNDSIDLATAVAPATKTLAFNINAGEGDDIVTLTAGIDSVTEADKIDGGAGFDTVVAEGKTLVAEDYILLDEVLLNFEAVRFETSSASVEADRMANYKVIEFHDAAGTATGVAADQKLVTSVDLTATAQGYKAGPPATYAGTLNVEAEPVNAGDTLVLTAYADTLNLTATAGASDKDGATTFNQIDLAGDVKTVTVAFTAVTDNNGTAGDTSDDAFDKAGINLDTAAEMVNLTSLKASGNGGVMLNNGVNAKLALIDLSGLAGTNPDGTLDQVSIINSDADIAETYKLGSGLDVLTINNSTFKNMDTIEGLTLVEDSAAPGTLDAAKSDSLTVNATGFVKTTITAGSLNLALTAAAALADDAVVFAFSGNTYIYEDTNADNILDDSDLLVKLVGTSVDLDLLAATL